MLDETYSYGTEAEYECLPGHLLVGFPIRICTGDGSSITGYFDGEEPYCQGSYLQ